MTKQLLITGYYGFGNTGDEAILKAVVHQVRERISDCRITVVSGDVLKTSAEHEVAAVDWRDIDALAAAIKTTDLIIIGGGGLYHDYWGVDTVDPLTPYHSGIAFLHTFVLLASLYQRPYMLLSVGVGPLETKDGRELTRLAFEHALFASVRDEESRELVHSLGVESQIHIAADPAFLLPLEDEEAVEHIFDTLSIDQNNPVYTVCVRYWDFGVDQNEWERELAQALDRMLKSRNGTILFIPFQREDISAYEDDWSVCQRIQGQMKNKDQTIVLSESPNPSLIASIIHRSDLVLAMRLHAVIFALRAKVPIIALSYDRKIAVHMEASGLSDFVLTPEMWKENQVTQLIAKALNQKEPWNSGLDKRIDEWTESCLDGFTFVANTLSGKQSEPQATDMSIAWAHFENQRQTQESLSKELERLLSESKIVHEDANRIRLEHEQLGKQKTALEQEIGEKYVQIEALNVQQNQLEQDLGSKDSQIETLKKQQNQLEQDLGSKDSQIQSLEQHEKQIQEDLVEHQSLIQALEQDRNTLNKEILGTKGQIRALESQRDQHLESINIKTELVKQQVQQMEEKSEVIDELEAKNRVQEVQLEELHAIKSGIGWIFLHLMWRVRLLFAPQGSRRERALLGIVRGYFFREIVQKVRGAISFRHMSWYEYSFDRFKRERLRIVPNKALNRTHGMLENKLVSIVLPAYNCEKFVAEAIDSLLNQTYETWELIAINDGSTDQTGEILDQFGRCDDRISILHQANRKIPATLSRGFDEATGEYLTWLSCDNRLKPTFLEKMVTSLRKHPNWDMVYANIDIIDEHGEPLRDSNRYAGYQNPPGTEHISLPKDSSELNIWPNNFIGAAFLYRQRTSALIGKYSPIRFTVEDYDYWMRINALLNLQHTAFEEQVYDYRFHPESITERDEKEIVEEFRPKLMIFDDFRRDFYLTPMQWWIQIEEKGNSKDAKLFIEQVRAKGHYVVDAASIRAIEGPGLWSPSIFVQFADHTDQVLDTPKDLPATTMKALILSSNEPVNSSSFSAGSWDLVIQIASRRLRDHFLYPPERVVVVDNPKAAYAVLDIRTRMIHLEHIERAIGDEKTDHYKITVIICTYGRGDALRPSILSLSEQTMPATDFEVLIVNNEPMNKGIDALVDELRETVFSDSSQCIKVIPCPVKGLSYARNVGIGCAQGEIVCFLDDDALADENWLEHTYAAYLGHPNVAVVGGQIVLRMPVPRPPWIRQDWDSYWSGLTPNYEEFTIVENWWEFPWGANWSARRRALLEIGGFRTKYGRKGTDYSGGEEIIAASCIKSAGYSIGFEPQSIVIHAVDSSRFSKRHVWKTVLSGRRTWYRAQRDLYLPMSISLKSTSRKLLKNFFLFIANARKNSLLLAAANLNADLNEFFWTIKDYVLRFRKQITLRMR